MRMLKRAQRRAKQAGKLVAKWEKHINEADRLQLIAKQPSFWNDTETEPFSGSLEIFQ